MSDKIRFTMHNYADLATLTASSEQGELLIANTQRIPRSKIWRSTSGAAQTITGNLNGVQTISTITVGRHNLTEGSTFEIWLYSGQQSGELANASHTITAAEAYETASVLEYQDLRNITWYSETAEHAKDPIAGVNSFKITLTGSGMSYVDVGRLFVGDFLEPTYNLSYGHNMSYAEKTKQFRTASGTLRSDMALPYKKFDFSLNTINEADRILMMEAFADVGKRNDFFVSAFPDAAGDEKTRDYSAIMKLNKIPRFTEFQSSWYKAKYSMEEV